MKQRILFFTPSFNRTGSEVVLCNLINKSVETFDMMLVSRIKGELYQTLNNKVPLQISSLIKKPRNSFFAKAINKICRKLVTIESIAMKCHIAFKPHFWYINTTTMPEIVSCAVKNNIPFIVHSHELEHMFSKLNNDDISNLISKSRLVIATSSIGYGVVKSYNGLTPVKISYPGVDINTIKSLAVNNDSAKRQHLGIKADAFIWLMSGTIDKNKNLESFIELLNKLVERKCNVHFIWIGHVQDENYLKECMIKIKKLKLEDNITFSGELKEEYYSYFSLCDGFVLTSKRESFSLVTLEALALGKPVLSFDCGGTREIITDDTGIIVNGFDELEMCKAMMRVMNGDFIFNSEAATSTVNNFSLHNQIQSWQKMLKEQFPLL